MELAVKFADCCMRAAGEILARKQRKLEQAEYDALAVELRKTAKVEIGEFLDVVKGLGRDGFVGMDGPLRSLFAACAMNAAVQAIKNWENGQ